MMNAIHVQQLTAGYQHHMILKQLDVAIPSGRITIIIGPNGCGKSTLLKNMARILKPSAGRILINNKDIRTMSAKAIARQMAILPQSPITPSGLIVSELVAYGRFPYQKPLGGLHKEDIEIIEWAMKETGVSAFQDAPVANLSGGQRQRVWIAMALAQKTDIILLDEPTTYLDIAYQLDVLELLKRLNREQGKTIVIVLHELNLACRYADHIIAMKDGTIVFEGIPNDVVTREHLSKLYGIQVQLQQSQDKRYPICVDFQIGD